MLGGGHPGRIVKISCETNKQKLHELMSKGYAIIHGNRLGSSISASVYHPPTHAPHSHPHPTLRNDPTTTTTTATPSSSSSHPINEDDRLNI